MKALTRRRSAAARRGRPRRRSAGDLWILAGLGGLSALLAPVLMAWLEPDAPPAAAVGAASSAPRREASATPRPAAPPRAPEPPPIHLSPPFEVADGLTIVTETQRVRIAGLDGPTSEAACFDPAGHLWACGLHARAALNNLIRTKDVTCRPTGATFGTTPLAECSIGSARLDRALVGAGFARPLPGNPAFGRELADARSRALGLWHGGWLIRE